MKPVRFQLDQSVEMLTAHSGLALIGLLLSHILAANGSGRFAVRQ
ncbi:hypothetical protein [Paenibacillus dendritiformis]|nr:hypothetical protein [Paenibacillus dendritiformis]